MTAAMKLRTLMNDLNESAKFKRNNLSEAKDAGYDQYEVGKTYPTGKGGKVKILKSNFYRQGREGVGISVTYEIVLKDGVKFKESNAGQTFLDLIRDTY